VMAHLSRWLEKRHWQSGDLTAARVGEFLKSRRREGYTTLLTRRGLAPLLDHLQQLKVVPMPQRPVADTQLDQFLERYEAHLRGERGLSAFGTVPNYQRVAREFLICCAGPDELRLQELTAADVTQFVVQDCQNRSAGYTKFRATALRSLLRFLYLEGATATRLDRALPGIASWRLSTLPRAVEPQCVHALLRSCDRRTAGGRRDHAILVVLARLGLRVGEVAALELDDIDWSRGELVIRGKGRRHERLPLPVDVGETIVGYLQRGRPRCECRNVFLRSRAPHAALSTSGIRHVVSEASVQAGVAHVSPHQLRHTLACQMLHRGASLSEIAQVLRHRSLQTTAIYAKVDRKRLGELAQPWPGDSV